MNNKLRVCHYPQIPCKPFIVEVKDEEQARLIEKTLIDQHLWLYENRIIPDYANAIAVEMYDENIDEETNKPYGWCCYYNFSLDLDWECYCEYLDNRDVNFEVI